MRCRSPAESADPRSPTTVAYPSGSRDTKSSMPAARAAARTSSSRRIRAGVANVFGDRGVKDERLLIDQDDVAPQVVEGEIPYIVSVDAHGARIGVEQPEQQVGDR